METTEIITIGTLSLGAIIAFVRLETKVANMKESHTEHKHDVAQKFKDVEKDRKDVEGKIFNKLDEVNDKIANVSKTLGRIEGAIGGNYRRKD